jgi:protein disulfide-isomerase A6
MVYAKSVAAAAAALLLALPVSGQGMYTKSSPVLQVDAKNYDRLIAQSNHTSVGGFVLTVAI